MAAVPGKLLTDTQAGQRKTDLVRHYTRDGLAIERTGVEPEHGAGRKPVRQLDRDSVTPRLALLGAQLAQAEVIRSKNALRVHQPVSSGKDVPPARAVLALGIGAR